MARMISRGTRARRRLRLMAVGVAGAGLLGLGAASPAQALTKFDCRATGLALGGTPFPGTVANPLYSPCAEQTVAFPMVFPDAAPVALQFFYARTRLRDPHWTQSYAAGDVIRIGPATGPHLLIEEAEASVLAVCRNRNIDFSHDGGVTDVHIVTPTPDPDDDERDTFVNVGNGYDYVRTPLAAQGLPISGILELNKTEVVGKKIIRTAVVVTDTSDPQNPQKILEVAKAEAGYRGC